MRGVDDVLLDVEQRCGHVVFGALANGSRSVSGIKCHGHKETCSGGVQRICACLASS